MALWDPPRQRSRIIIIVVVFAVDDERLFNQSNCMSSGFSADDHRRRLLYIPLPSAQSAKEFKPSSCGMEILEPVHPRGTRRCVQVSAAAAAAAGAGEQASRTRNPSEALEASMR